MARNQSQSDLPQAPVAFAVPEGFKRSGSANAVGWFNQGKIGNILSGKLLGMFTRKDGLRPDGTSNFFQVQVDQVCEVRVERGDDAHMVEAKAGDVVNVNYGPKTKPWENYVQDINHGAVYEVKGVIAGSKIKIGQGRSLHNFDVYDKMVTPPMVANQGDFDGSVDAADETV